MDRISDRPSKLHVADGLDGFRDFVEKQMMSLAAARRKRHAAAGSSARAGASGSKPTPPVPHTVPSTSDTIENVD